MIKVLQKLLSNSYKKNNQFLSSIKIFIFILSLISVTYQTNAQVAAYTFSGSGTGQTYTAISTGTAVFGSTTWDDNVATNVPINFNFTFNGAVYTTANISSNGFITFGTTAPTTTNFSPISSTEAYKGAISAYGSDLTNQTLDCKYATTGSVGSRVFTVEYLSTKRRVSGAVQTGTWTFQINLYEGTNVVEIKYKVPSPAFGNAGATPVYGQIGLRGTSNTDYNNLSLTTAATWPITAYSSFPWGNFSAGTANTSNVLTRNTSLPGGVITFKWTPVSCSAPNFATTAVTAITSNSATINWTAVSPAPTIYPYEYYITTSATPPANGSTATGTAGSIGATSFNITSGILPSTPYYVYIRTRCDDNSTSNWSTTATFTSLCTPQPDPLVTPYFNDFGTPATVIPTVAPNMTNVLPSCTSRQNAGIGNDWTRTDGDLYYTDSAFGDSYMMIYNGQSGTGTGNTANAWFFTEGINLTGGTTYQISFLYGGTVYPSTVVNKMKIAYGTSPSAASMTIPIDDLPNIKGSPFTDSVNFTVPSSGVYYFGFNAYSTANQGQLYLDDVSIVPAVCLKPTAVTVANIGATGALLSWTAPTPAPAQGYVYYYAPAVATATSVTAGSFVIGNVYQITSVGTTDFTLIGASANAVGVQFTATGSGTGSGTALLATPPTNPTNASTGNGAVGPGVTSVNLTGLSSATVYYFWVRTNCGGGDYGEWVPLTNGAIQYFTTIYQPPYCIPNNALTSSYFNNFATTGGFANITNPSGLSPNGYGNFTNLIVSQAPGGTINFTTGLVGVTVGVALWVDWNNDGTFSTAERMYNTGTYVSTASGSFNVPAGQALGEYRMRIVMDYLAISPNPCTFSGAGEAEDYTLKVVPTPPALTLNSYSSVQCASTNSPLIQITSTLANYSSYSWSPNIGITGNPSSGYTFNSNSTIVYTLTATQSFAPYSTKSVTYTYTANPLPTAITITTPSGTAACQSGPGIPLTASGGIVSGVPILSENFNSGFPATWTAINASTGGSSAVPAWTPRPNGYSPGGTSGVGAMSSNDATQFILSNSDGQGSGTTTDVSLITASFSLVGYTNASVSFYHYYKPWINGSAEVSISTDNFTTYTVLQTWGNSSNTVSQGTPTAFTNVNYNLAAYLGNANVKIRFRYQASWGFVWAIDNFAVTGSAATSVVWNTLTTPVANGVAVPGLFTTAAGTTAYLAGTGAATVYAIPSANTTYTASASTPTPVCTTTATIPITVIPIVAGTVSSTQTICSGTTAANLTLSGQTGTIVQWQWSTSPTFASGINNIPSSASATLTGAQIGAITNTTYYRVEISNGSCNHVFTPPVAINVNTTTWNGSAWSNGVPNSSTKAIFNGNYTSSGNITACSVQVLSGIVDFLTNNNLIVTNEVTVTGGTLKFEDSSSLVQTNNVTNSGAIQYNRNTTPMVTFDYTYWSAPVAGQEIHAFSPLTLSDKYFLWDTGPAYNWSQTASSYNMIPGKGYIIRAPQGWPSTAASWTGTFTGVPNNGDISIPIVVSGANNLNLIGNPYPCSLNADAFLSDTANASKINGSIYLWTHNTPYTSNNYNNNDYAVWNIFGGTGTRSALNSGVNNNIPNGHVAAGNAFFVVGTANGNVTFKNSMRETGNNSSFFRMNAPVAIQAFEKHRLWLEISNDDGLFKQILVGYAQGATTAVDRNYDAISVNGGNPLSLYSIVGLDHLNIKANGLPFSDQDLHPLGYSTTTAGAYKIDMPLYDGLFQNQDVYLEDKLLNVIYNLKQGTYNFTTQAGTFNDRFVLRFTPAALSINTNSYTNDVIIFKNTSGIHIESTNTNIKEVSISDIRGRIIYSTKGLNTAKFDIDALSIAQEVIIVQVTTQNGSIINKKIVY